MRHNYTDNILYKQNIFRLFSVELKTVDRIKQYLELKGISFNAFDKAIEAGNGYFGKQVKRQGSIGSDIIEKIVYTYPDINPLWLITGRGEMLISESSNPKEYNTPSDTDIIHVNHEPVSAYNAPPTNAKTAPPNAPPSHNFGHPSIITVNENNEDLINLVSVKAAAGYLRGYADPEYIESLPTIRVPGLKGATHRAFESKGHSMAPTIHDRAILIGSWVESLDYIKDRRIYIVVTKEQGITVKRVLNRVEESGKLVLLSDNHNKIDYPNFAIGIEEVKEIWYLKAGLIHEFREPNELYSRFNDLEAQVTIMADKLKKLGV